MTHPGEMIFAQWHEELISLSPFLHFLNDTTGHETYLCFFKGKKDGKYWYEPIKVRTETTFETCHARFDTEYTQLAGLMVP
jgi:hypothetical protein